jgi:superfamily II DNA or RNA helicase
VFIDEAHLAKAKSLTGIMTKLHDCKYRIGLTGTLDGKEVHRLVLEGLFGVCDQVTTTAELVKKKVLSNLEIKCLVLEHTKSNKIKRTYQEEMDYLVSSESRNLFLINLISTLEGNSLVLAQYIEKHLIPLHALAITLDKQTYLVYGNTPTDEREKIRSLVENSKSDSVILASYGTFSTGINIKRLHNIVFASPYKSQIRVLQSIGRGLRVSKDKEMLKIFDISDNLMYNNKENYTLLHLKERVRLYNEQDFQYEIVPIKLKR